MNIPSLLSQISTAQAPSQVYKPLKLGNRTSHDLHAVIHQPRSKTILAMRKCSKAEPLSMKFSASNCLLLLVDIQRTFLDKLPEASAADLLKNNVWLTDVAAWLDVPVMATVEDGRYPELMPPLRERLNAEQVFTKTSYNAADDKFVLRALLTAGRELIVVTGLETDVCVAQTVLGLLENGYQVAFVEDLLAAPADSHASGLERMHAAGATSLTLRALFYEWMGDTRVERTFRNEQPLLYSNSPINF